VRKIIHCDMDAFYASVEQRDVIVASKGNRSIVCAASYARIAS
jgi:DNA polymerase-4